MHPKVRADIKESPLLLGGIPRKVCSSPPTYSLDQVFAGFRTRSQMLMGHLEDQDEVLHCQFSDNSDDEDSEGQEKPRVRYVTGLLVSIVLIMGGFSIVASFPFNTQWVVSAKSVIFTY